jgi:hypothetical protein
VEESLDYANAAGARAVTVRGPMEGTSSFAELQTLRARGSSTGRARGRFVDWFQGAGLSPVPAGMTSVCSAHPLVLEAAMLRAAPVDEPVLIEATCNQVNHLGGYTGLTPAAFRDGVYSIADRVSFPRHRVLLGGDHLGPNPWRHLPAQEAMAQAELMVAAYVAAGFEKIHLDTSMGCLGEAAHVTAGLTAARAARLAVVAQQAGQATGTTLRYVIGTEVPTPGGAKDKIEHLEATRPEAVRATMGAHRDAFAAAGAHAAYESIIALVVQPGFKFDDQKVVVYQRPSFGVPQRKKHPRAPHKRVPPNSLPACSKRPFGAPAQAAMHRSGHRCAGYLRCRV